MTPAWCRWAGVLIAARACLGSAPGARAADGGGTALSQSRYAVNENAGSYPITIERTTDLARPEVVDYGVTIKGAQAGRSFDGIANTRAVIPAGQSSYTFRVRIRDQGINGPARWPSVRSAASPDRGFRCSDRARICSGPPAARG